MEKYKIQIKKSVKKDILKISQKDIRRINEIMGSLVFNPHPKNSKKLSDQDKYRIRTGNYRILYQIEKQILTIIVIKVSHRKDVYTK